METNGISKISARRHSLQEPFSDGFYRAVTYHFSIMNKYHAGILTVLLLGTFPALAEEDLKTNMPEPFNDIYIGMALKDFVQIRPAARDSDPFSKAEKIDVENPEQLLMERFDNPSSFTWAMYFFKDGRLQIIGAATPGKGQMLADKWEAFLRGALGKWGQPDQLDIRKIRNDQHAPVLLWKRGSLLIQASLISNTEDEKTHPGSGLEMRIMNAETVLPDDIFASAAGIDEAERKKIISPIKAMIERLIKEAPPATQVSKEQH